MEGAWAGGLRLELENKAILSLVLHSVCHLFVGHHFTVSSIFVFGSVLWLQFLLNRIVEPTMSAPTAWHICGHLSASILQVNVSPFGPSESYRQYKPLRSRETQKPKLWEINLNYKSKKQLDGKLTKRWIEEKWESNTKEEKGEGGKGDNKGKNCLRN